MYRDRELIFQKMLRYTNYLCIFKKKFVWLLVTLDREEARTKNLSTYSEIILYVRLKVFLNRTDSFTRSTMIITHIPRCSTYYLLHVYIGTRFNTYGICGASGIKAFIG